MKPVRLPLAEDPGLGIILPGESSKETEDTKKKKFQEPRNSNLTF